MIFVEMRYQGARADTSRPIYELFFNERPELVLARLQQRMVEQQADSVRREQERFLRGGIRVGMSKQQVLSSTWGQPDRIQMGVVGGRVREQWIYGTNTLFFEDNTLTTVQTER
jgi:hypothetical protein